MSSPKIIVPILSLTLMAFLVPHMRSSAQQNAARRAQAAGVGTVIFSLSKDPEGGFHLQPIVIVNGRKYTPPPSDAGSGVLKKFADNYFRVGREYPVIFGGGAAGSLTVQNYVADTCGNLMAEVGVQTTARLGGEVQALATSSDKIGSGATSRRAPTDAERASALEVARAVYGQ